jgi:hypothetical protein
VKEDPRKMLSSSWSILSERVLTSSQWSMFSFL